MKKWMMAVLALALVIGLWGLTATEAKADVTIDVTAATYGANGADSADDADQIQKALDVAKTETGTVTVKIPAGNYLISKMLFIYSNTILSLDDGATISNMGGNHLMLVNKAEDMNDGGHGGYTRSQNITVKGGTWDARADGSAATNIMLIAHAENVTVSGVTLKHCCGNHFLELNSVKNGKVTGCTFRDFVKANGIDYSSETGSAGITPVTEALQLDYAGSGGAGEGDIPADKTPCVSITVSGNTFENVMAGVGNHHEGDKGYGYTISNNTFRNVHKNCVNLFYFEKGDIKVTNNTAENVRQFATAIPGSGTDSARIVIEGNKATASTADPGERNAVFIMNPNTGKYKNPAHFTIKGNTFSGFANGVHLNTCDDFIISNNTITKSESCAIRVHTVTKCTITGNTATECGEYNIGIFNGCTGKVEGNTYDKSYGIWIVNSDGMTRGSNTYQGHSAEADYITIYYHKTDSADASSKVTYVKIGSKENLLSVSELGYATQDSTFLGWKVYREETKEWRVEDSKGNQKWSKDLPSGYKYTLYEDKKLVRKPVEAGGVLHLYGQWKAGNDGLGDVNDDGIVDGRDAVRLKRFLNKEKVKINKTKANVNRDKKVNDKDLKALLGILADVDRSKGVMTDSLTIDRGETVTVDVTLTSSNAAFVRIGYSFNEDVFEFVSATCRYGAATRSGFACLRLGEAVKGVIGTITLKVKDGAPYGAYALNLKVTEAYKDNEKNGKAKVAAVKIPVGSKEATVGGLKYRLTPDNNATLLAPVNRNTTSVTIPDKVTVDGVKYNVTGIADNAMKKCTSLKTVKIGKNVAKIGKAAFNGCKNLASITVKTTKLTADGIGKNAFKGIFKKAKIKCPKAKVEEYRKLFTAKGAPKTATFTK